jgi:4-hydroxybenzoate polyprenyltransferase
LNNTYHFHFTLLTSIQALASALCMNIYVVGLNQLFDIEIDKVIFQESAPYCSTLLIVLSRKKTYDSFEGQ